MNQISGINQKGTLNDMESLMPFAYSDPTQSLRIPGIPIADIYALQQWSSPRDRADLINSSAHLYFPLAQAALGEAYQAPLHTNAEVLLTKQASNMYVSNIQYPNQVVSVEDLASGGNSHLNSNHPVFGKNTSKRVSKNSNNNNTNSQVSFDMNGNSNTSTHVKPATKAGRRSTKASNNNNNSSNNSNNILPSTSYPVNEFSMHTNNTNNHHSEDDEDDEDSDVQRKRHRESETRRRGKLRDQFQVLSDMVQCSKKTRAHILSSAVNQLQFYQLKVQDLEKQLTSSNKNNNENTNNMNGYTQQLQLATLASNVIGSMNVNSMPYTNMNNNNTTNNNGCCGQDETCNNNTKSNKHSMVVPQSPKSQLALLEVGGVVGSSQDGIGRFFGQFAHLNDIAEIGLDDYVPSSNSSSDVYLPSRDDYPSNQMHAATEHTSVLGSTNNNNNNAMKHRKRSNIHMSIDYEGNEEEQISYVPHTPQMTSSTAFLQPPSTTTPSPNSSVQDTITDSKLDTENTQVVTTVVKAQQRQLAPLTSEGDTYVRPPCMPSNSTPQDQPPCMSTMNTPFHVKTCMVTGRPACTPALVSIHHKLLSNVAICQLSLDGKFIDCNGEFEQHSTCARSELADTSIFDQVSGDNAQQVLKTMKLMLDDKLSVWESNKLDMFKQENGPHTFILSVVKVSKTPQFFLGFSLPVYPNDDVNNLDDEEVQSQKFVSSQVSKPTRKQFQNPYHEDKPQSNCEFYAEPTIMVQQEPDHPATTFATQPSDVFN